MLKSYVKRNRKGRKPKNLEPFDHHIFSCGLNITAEFTKTSLSSGKLSPDPRANPASMLIFQRVS